MNKGAIIGLSIIAIAVTLLLFVLQDAGTYATFKEADENPDKEITIIGQLNKQKEVIYNPEVNTDLTTMFVFDANGEEREVRLHKAKPRDVEKSENITLTGKMVNGVFNAETILVKCPSKYQDGKMDTSKLMEQKF